MKLDIAKTRSCDSGAWKRRARLLQIAAPVLMLSSLSAYAGDAAVTITSASKGAAYGWADSFFMLSTDPVAVVIGGEVSELSEPSLVRSVAAGMSSAAPMTCCADTDDSFRAKAPLDFAPAAPGASEPDGQYKVVWQFRDKAAEAGPADARTVTASAELWHLGAVLTRAEGAASVGPNASATDWEQAITALAKTVETRLTPFPNNWIPRTAGGG